MTWAGVRGPCRGPRRWLHALRRSIDLAVLRWVELDDSPSDWFVPYAVAKARVRRFNDVTVYANARHWDCACGTPVRQRERQQRMDDVYRAQVSR
jgi:hypothetical protein